MADKTHHETSLSRLDAANYLQSLSTELSDEASSWTVPVGNKTVETHPNSTLNVETTVDERSRLMGDNITEVTIQLSWKENAESTEEGAQ